MKRREFLTTAAALGAGGAAWLTAQERLPCSVDYPGRAAGHALRDVHSLPEPGETLDTEVLIAGGGIAGLSARWQLAKLGVGDTLLVAGPEPYGNAAGGRDGDLTFPTGAHYLPLPSRESTHIRAMLGDFGIIQGDPYADRPTYDERYVVHGPAERVMYRGIWQDGYLPGEDVAAAERSEHLRFFRAVETFSSARGEDGRRAFAVPVELSSGDERFRALDRMTFRAWLAAGGFRSPTLHWYLNYCCRDDYGRRYDEVSAWAGLHYFCSRDGLAANAERGAVLTWPQGLAALADRLAETGGGASLSDASVASLRIAGAGVEAVVLVRSAEGLRSVRVRARQAIAAMPLYVLQHVLHDPGRHGFVAARDVPGYAPWLVANFLMRAFPEERPGAPLSWDNVVYEEPGLGYVVSTHQDIRMSRPDRTAFTAYHALSDLAPEEGRRWLESASPAALARLAGRDLRMAYGWRLPLCVERVAITVRGHAMAIPRPGFLSNPGRISLRDAPGPIFFAHSDLSGLSLFEEASWWGCQAARRAAAART